MILHAASCIYAKLAFRHCAVCQSAVRRGEHEVAALVAWAWQFLQQCECHGGNGTSCTRPPFMRLDGMVISALLKSISLHDN